MAEVIQELPKTGGTQEIYLRNMTALWRRDARLAIAIEAVHPDEAPGVERAREGNWTVQVKGAGAKNQGSVYLHSRYRPVEEAAKWAESLALKDRYAVSVAGYGLGHHILELFLRIAEDAILVVAEPNLGLLKAAFQAVDASEAIGSGRVLIFTELDRAAVVERLEPRTVLFTAGAGMLLANHAASTQVAEDFHRAFQKILMEFIAFSRTGMITLMLNSVTTCRNIANNLGRYVTTPAIDMMANAFAGRPAILVAAGPSLAKNMHLLKETRNSKLETRNFVVIAVQTMLKPLLAAGIEPDFVTALDYNTVSTRFFENLEESGSVGHVHLVAQPTVHWNVPDVFAGTMSMTHNDFAAKLLREAFPKREGLRAGATVAHLSFYLAEYLGCDPIILVGQDLGFVDGLYYKPGTAIHETWGVELSRFNTLETKEWERIVRSRTILRKIPDIHGHPMYTEEQFFVYLQQFERDFAASRAKVIDATEGGARKQGVEVMTLREAMEGYCKPILNSEFRIQNWKGWRCDAAGNLEKAMGALKLRRGAAEAMRETCEKTIPLLREMIEHQKDEARMNRLFVEVDRLRSKVGHDSGTFEMAGQMNTIGEMRRLQADLAVKSAKNDPLEYQKRQLERDIEYVRELQIGCERLLELLDEAMRRLGGQLEAVREGRAWPREIAGSGKGAAR